MYATLLLCVCLLQVHGGFYEGDSCEDKGVRGICKNIKRCPSAMKAIVRKMHPQKCSFDGFEPIVCCTEDRDVTTELSVPPAQPVPSVPPGPSVPPVQTVPSVPTVPFSIGTTTSPEPVRTTTEEEDNDYRFDNTAIRRKCPKILPHLTRSKNGLEKSLDKCIEYQEKYVYPCESSAVISTDGARANYCAHNADELVIGGKDAKRGEFPHMVLLGYGNDVHAAEWLCGGSIVSEKFILTAAHCTITAKLVNVSFARLETLKRSDPIDPTRVYRIGRIVKHPDYASPAKYNDIALLETETEMRLSRYAVPICLPVNDYDSDLNASVIGFGSTKHRGASADHLQKVTLTKFENEECEEIYPPNTFRHIREGYQERTQLCYGDKTQSRDTCQGDSGGPLQLNNKDVHCMFLVVGVTSFGQACGDIGQPGIYTLVRSYVPWIESVVWP